jgi:serine/threonine protein kinase
MSIKGPDGQSYTLASFLGRGGFGEVFRAEDEANTTVAVKFVNSEFFQDDQILFALLNEAKAASRVTHENVLRVLHAGKSDDLGPYLITEFADSGTLADLISEQRKQGPMDIERTKNLMLQVALGCQAINNILIHRDLKPDNIFRHGSRLKIGDFGIAKLVDESTRTHTFKGIQHVRYKCPESWRFEMKTVKIDVYSAGLIFYEILSLKHPLQDAVRDPSDWRDCEQAHLTNIPSSLRKIRPEIGLTLAQLIDRMISKRPEDRPEWSEIIQRLNSTIDTVPPDPGIAAALAAAIKRKEERDKVAAKAEQRRLNLQMKDELYKTSCQQLLRQLGRSCGRIQRTVPGRSNRGDSEGERHDLSPCGTQPDQFVFLQFT